MVIQVVNPIIEEQLAIFRDSQSSIQDVYKSVDLISIYLAGEVSKLLDVDHKNIQTPLGIADSTKIMNNIELIPIARAGLAMLPAFQKLLPCVHVGIVAASRQEDLTVDILYNKISNTVNQKTVIILDTMLATGNTINKIISYVKDKGCSKIIVACILATPVGIENIQKNSEIPIFAVKVNETLDKNNYIYPGVGDSGDRLFGISKNKLCKE